MENLELICNAGRAAGHVCRDAENGGVMFADYDANAVEPIWAVTLRLAVCVCSCCFAYLGLGAV